nr:2-oxoacid:acceptor oxidoreductase family protein [Sporomusa acidovorans]
MINEVKGKNKNDFHFLEVTPDEKAEAKEQLELRLSGSGGQGLILAGVLLGEAAIMAGKNAVHSQSYGTEARGGASRSEVIISDKDIDFPEVHNPDVLLVMTQQSCDKFAATVKAGGTILVDSTLVETVPEVNAKIYRLPITQIAIEEFKTAIVANVIAVGALAKITGIAPIAMLEKIVAARVPARTKETNIKALLRGYECAGQQE